jgi:cold shock CspA family protein
MGFLDSIKRLFGGKKTSANGTGEKVTGKITHFNYRKGYGFVEAPSLGDKVFLHISELSGRAKTGKKIEFTPLHTDKGIKATGAVVLN